MLDEGFPSGMPAVFSSDGRWLVTLSRQSGRLFDLTAEDPVASSRELRGDSLQSAAFGPDRHWLATAGMRVPTRLWDLRAADPAATVVSLRGGGHVRCVEITPDGRWLISTASSGFIRLRHLRIDGLIEVARRKAGRELTEEERQQYHLGQ